MENNGIFIIVTMVIYFIISATLQLGIKKIVTFSVSQDRLFNLTNEMINIGNSTTLRVKFKQNADFAYYGGNVFLPQKAEYSSFDLFALAHKIGHASDSARRKQLYLLYYLLQTQTSYM